MARTFEERDSENKNAEFENQLALTHYVGMVEISFLSYSNPRYITNN